MIVCDREHLGLVDVSCRRNAFGRQIASFEADLELAGIGPEPLRAVFIRAPWVEPESATGVEVLAEVDGHPVAVRDGSVRALLVSPRADGGLAGARTVDGDGNRRERAREAAPAGAPAPKGES